MDCESLRKCKVREEKRKTVENAWAMGLGGGGGRNMPAAYNSKTIHDIEMEVGDVV